MKKINLFCVILVLFGSQLANGQMDNEMSPADSIDLQLTSRDSIVVSSWIVGLGWNAVNDSGKRFQKLSESEFYNIVAFPSRATLGRYFRSGIGLEAIMSYNQYKEGKIIDGMVNPEDKDYFGIDARFSYDLNKLFGHTGFFDPYVGVGVGYTDANDVGRGTYNAVVGFRTWFNHRWGLDFNSSGKWSMGSEGGNHVQHAAGVVYQFNMEKELSKKGAKKLAMIQEMERERQRQNDSIEAARKAEEEALALAERLAREEAEAKEKARLEAEELQRKEQIMRAVSDLGYVYFDFNSSYLNDDSKSVLDKLVILMSQHSDLSISVSSHADSRGPSQYNLWLSERRATRTTDYMVEQGISPDRVEAKGLGEEELVNHCKDGVKCTAAEHSENRRSEFTITKY